MLISNGCINRYPSDTAIFFHKGLEQRFAAAGSSYANDYMHFGAEGEEVDFIRSLKIPHAVAFTGLDSSVFLSMHRYLCIEHTSDSPYRDVTVDYLLRLFLIKLSQAISESELEVGNVTRIKIKKLRTEIYDKPENDWNISFLASKVNLSESYFQSVYKQIFGHPAIADVISARIEKAKSFLATTDYAVGHISNLCGYENESHFSRQFKKHVGMSPGEYRRLVQK